MRKKVGLQARWPSTLAIFILPISLVVMVRSFFYEPFVIPSESMLPNLQIHDHIIVEKLPFGLKLPFTNKWLINLSHPQRGDVVVFKFPENPEIFYIKRLIGLPGDKVRSKGMNLWVNDELLSLKPLRDDIFLEENNGKSYEIQFTSGGLEKDEDKEFVVPKNSYFVMGDNRYNSYDSRYWGFVSRDLFMGRAKWIWLSCEEMLASAPFLCDLKTVRTERVFSTIH